MDSATQSTIERQRAHYEQLASKYDAKYSARMSRCHRAKIARIHRHLQVQAGDRVLEVGTGTGIHASWLRELCPIRYCGVDLSPQMLLVARERLGEDVELVEAAAERLPFYDASFDAVYCSGTLHHVADKSRAIREMARVAKPGGRIVVSEPNPWNPLNALSWSTSRLERGQLDMRVSRLRPWIEEAGLVISSVQFFNFTPPRPSALSGVFDQVDAIASKAPVIRRIASMLLIAANVPAADPTETG